MSLFFCACSLNSSNTTPQEKKTVSLSASEITLNIDSDPEKLEDGTYPEGAEISFEITDESYSEVQLKLSGSERSWTYDMSLSGNRWGYVWDTSEPTSGEEPVPSDTYSITLTIDGDDYDSDPDEIVISSQQEGNILVIVVIIIAVIAAVSLSALIVIRKKRSSKAEDMEFGSVDKTKAKKKGKVYKGASSIGRRSGQIAESKSKKTTSGPESGPEALGPSSSESKTKTKVKAKTSKKMMEPVSSKYKFETKSSAMAAMVKDMELKMSVEQKLDFLISKAEAGLQNIEFFKAILLQYEQEELRCPDCDQKMSEYWITCPYCKIKDSDSELSLKQSMLAMEKDVEFCPDCKRLIKPGWIKCPYCFVAK